MGAKLAICVIKIVYLVIGIKVGHESESQLKNKIGKIERENKRLRKMLEQIVREDTCPDLEWKRAALKILGLED